MPRRDLAGLVPIHRGDRRSSLGSQPPLLVAIGPSADFRDDPLTTSSFYAFEVGKRYTGPELSRLIADAHRSGRILQWNIGPIDARIDCNTASAAWENSGAAGTAARLEPRAWLESARLIRQGERWLIDFRHSAPKDPRP